VIDPEDGVVVACTIAEKAWRSRRLHALGYYVVEVAKMGVRMGADVASRMTVTLSHGPVSVTIAPKEKPETVQP
jgi:hypothetical protein